MKRRISNSMPGITAALGAALLAAVLVLPVAAADRPDDRAARAAGRAARDQARRIQQQLLVLEKEKAEALARKTQLEAELKEAQEKVGDTTQRAAGATRRAGELAKALDTLKHEHEQLQGRLLAEQTLRQETERRRAEREREAAGQRVAFEAEKRRLETQGTQLAEALAASRERNERMYKLGFELIDLYENKGVWTSALQAEPFTGLKRAQIEKMAEDEREKLDKERLPPAR